MPNQGKHHTIVHYQEYEVQRTINNDLTKLDSRKRLELVSGESDRTLVAARSLSAALSRFMIPQVPLR
jgi:hypothetical protein